MAARTVPGTIKATLAVLSVTLVAVFASGCDTLECGPGTHRESDGCVPNVLVACAEGTEFVNGSCVSIQRPDQGVPPDRGPTLTCGAGTHEDNGMCVPDVRPDRGPEPDAGPDTDMIIPDAALVPDMAPDMAPPPPRCPPELEPGTPPACNPVGGTYCVVGVATDYLTGCALPSDQGLIIALIDPLVAAAGGDPLGVVPVGEGGQFSFRINQNANAALLAIVIDEAPNVESDLWNRAVSGVLGSVPVAGEIYGARAFSSSKAAQAIWNTELGFGEGELEQRGYLIGRVLTVGPMGLAPVPNKRVLARGRGDLSSCAADMPCMRYFDDDPRLISFQEQGANQTGASGGFMLIHAGNAPLQDLFYVDGDDNYADLPAGTNAGSGFHTAFVPAQ